MLIHCTEPAPPHFVRLSREFICTQSYLMAVIVKWLAWKDQPRRTRLFNEKAIMLSFVYLLSILNKITITNHENSTHLSFFSLFPFHLSVNHYIPKVCDVFQEITTPYDYKKLGRSQIMNQMDSLKFENILKRFFFHFVSKLDNF